jgi:hypothetical protein
VRAAGRLGRFLAGWLAVWGGVSVVAGETFPRPMAPQEAVDWLLSTNEEGDRVRAIQAVRAWNIADRPMLTALQVLSLRDPSAAVRNAARQAYLEMRPSLPDRRREFAARGAAILRDWEWRENVEELDDGAPATGPAESPEPPAAGAEGSAEDESQPEPEAHGPAQVAQAAEPPPPQQVRAVAAGEAESASAINLVPLTVEQDAVPPPVSPATIEKILRESSRNAAAPGEPHGSARTPIPRTQAAPPPDLGRSLDGLSSTGAGVEKSKKSIRIESVAGKPAASPAAVESASPAPRLAAPPVAAAEKPAPKSYASSEHATSQRVPSTESPAADLPPAWNQTASPASEIPERPRPKSWIAADQLPRDESSRKAMARELLVKGRQLIQSGKVDEAEDVLFQVRELAVHYRRLEYSPKSLARDIALAREVARRKAVAAKDAPAVR